MEDVGKDDVDSAKAEVLEVVVDDGMVNEVDKDVEVVACRVEFEVIDPKCKVVALVNLLFDCVDVKASNELVL